MTTIEQLAAFHQFAMQQLQSGNDLSIQNLLSIWQDQYLLEDELEHADTDELLVESAKELETRYQNWKSGKPALTAEEFMKKFKEMNNIE